VTADGAVFTGLSTGAGGAGATNATVQALVDEVPDAIRRVTTGCCGEIDAFSKALNAGAKLDGATAATIRIASEKIIEGCPACKWVAEKLGVNLVPKP
jgi:hypothetical protein